VIAIECSLDLANHIIASEGYRIPTSAADSFAVLTEQGLLPPDRHARLPGACPAA
jgi:uncharacterized protein YutE (UPF0331/DUF86 family)